MPEVVKRGADGQITDIVEVNDAQAHEKGYSGLDTILGHISAGIPAADLSLSGGASSGFILDDADVNEVINFSEFLESDEVFEVYDLWVAAYPRMASTSTAEGQFHAEGALSRVSDLSAVIGRGLSDRASSPDEDGSIDVVTDEAKEDGVLDAWAVWTEKQFMDSTNGNHGGSGQYSDHRRHIPFRHLYGSGPIFDADDELYGPMELVPYNVSDHFVSAEMRVILRGMIQEINC